MILALVSMLATGIVHAGNRQPVPSALPVCPASPIKLAFYEFGLLFDNGEGIDKDVIDELAKRTDCKFQSQVQVRARIWSDLESGVLDMSVSGIRTPQRDSFAWFAPYLSIKNQAVLGTKAANSVKSANDFVSRSELVFGVVRSFKHGTAQDRLIQILREQGRVVESPDVLTLFQKLKSGRIDAMFSQQPVYTKYLKDLGIETTTIVQDWTPGEKGVPHGLILAKSRFPEVEAKKWQAVVQEMHSDGTLRKIFQRRLTAKLVEQLLEF